LEPYLLHQSAGLYYGILLVLLSTTLNNPKTGFYSLPCTDRSCIYRFLSISVGLLFIFWTFLPQCWTLITILNLILSPLSTNWIHTVTLTKIILNFVCHLNLSSYHDKHCNNVIDQYNQRHLLVGRNSFLERISNTHNSPKKKNQKQ
jgi:hypothetical protein